MKVINNLLRLWQRAEIYLAYLIELSKKNKIKFNDVNKFPESRRDFALLIDRSIKFNKIKKIAFQKEKKILTKVTLFDVYEGESLPKGKKSYGVSFYFQDRKKNLTDKYIDKVMNMLQREFENKIGAELR